MDRDKDRLVAKGFSQKDRCGFRVNTLPRYQVHQTTNGGGYSGLPRPQDFTIRCDIRIPHCTAKRVTIRGRTARICENRGTVFRLHKALYGLRQAARSWSVHLLKILSSLGFYRSISDESLFIRKQEDGGVVMIVAYVDGMSLPGSSEDELRKIAREI